MGCLPRRFTSKEIFFSTQSVLTPQTDKCSSRKFAVEIGYLPSWRAAVRRPDQRERLTARARAHTLPRAHAHACSPRKGHSALRPCAPLHSIVPYVCPPFLCRLSCSTRWFDGRLAKQARAFESTQVGPRHLHRRRPSSARLCQSFRATCCSLANCLRAGAYPKVICSGPVARPLNHSRRRA